MIRLANHPRILAAEPRAADADRLADCLRLLGFRAQLAASPEQVLQLMRGNLFRAAVIAMELTLQGRPLLERLRRLPSMECLVATGPGGDQASEAVARQAGATAYLPRPVAPASLGNALRVSAARAV